jgi:hypothetical protein
VIGLKKDCIKNIKSPFVSEVISGGLVLGKILDQKYGKSESSLDQELFIKII